MFQTHFDTDTTKKVSSEDERRLNKYRTHIEDVFENHVTTAPEYSLCYPTNAEYIEKIHTLTSSFKKQRYVVVIGIGGSSLGVEAVHEAVGTENAVLITLDIIDPEALEQLEELVSSLKKVTDLVLCVISKSGGTTETLANAAIALRLLEAKFGTEIYKQTFFIGDAGTDFMKTGKKLGATCVSIPKIIGGRYSVATEVGLIPLALLGHDVEQFIDGYLAAANDEHEVYTTAASLRLFRYLKAGYRHYNFFAFSKRLLGLGRWYRQLVAESIGKTTTRTGTPATFAWLPTYSTPVELHSVGQLYLSGFKGVYTEFVSIDDDSVDYQVGPTKLAPTLKKFSLEEINTALYGGVVATYQEQKLPHRATVLSDNILFSLGLFMGMRLRETMYLAELLDCDAFDQPSVELYKINTRKLLGL